MNTLFDKYMTQNMLDQLIEDGYLKEEIEHCLENLIAARVASNTPLPTVAFDGETPVRHGARVVMYSLVEYWGKRIDAAIHILDTTPLEIQYWLARLGLPRHVFGKYKDYGIVNDELKRAFEEKYPELSRSKWS